MSDLGMAEAMQGAMHEYCADILDMVVDGLDAAVVNGTMESVISAIKIIASTERKLCDDLKERFDSSIAKTLEDIFK